MIEPWLIGLETYQIRGGATQETPPRWTLVKPSLTPHRGQPFQSKAKYYSIWLFVLMFILCFVFWYHTHVYIYIYICIIYVYTYLCVVQVYIDMQICGRTYPHTDADIHIHILYLCTIYLYMDMIYYCIYNDIYIIYIYIMIYYDVYIYRMIYIYNDI